MRNVQIPTNNAERVEETVLSTRMRTVSEQRWYIYLVLGLIDQNCSSGNVTSLSISNTVAEVHNGSARTLTANFPVLVFKRLRCPDDAVQQTRLNVGYSSDLPVWTSKRAITHLLTW